MFLPSTGLESVRVSEAKSLTTVGITEPGEVMNFTVTATGSTTIKLDWDPPTDTGGARIIGYLIHTCETNKRCHSDTRKAG